MRRVMFNLAFIVFCTSLLAQPTGVGPASQNSWNNLNENLTHLDKLMTLLNNTNNGSYSKTLIRYRDIEGSPFLLDESRPATLVLTDESVVRDIPINYDLYAGDIVATLENGDQVVLDSRFLEEIFLDLNGQLMQLKKPYPDKENKFVEILYESDETVVFKEQSLSLREERNSGISFHPAKFIQTTRYYIKGEDNSVVKINLKKKDLFDHLPQKESDALLNVAKTSKIKLKSEDDYRRLFAAMKNQT